MQEPATTSAFLAVMCAIGVVSGSDAYPVIISSFAGATLYMTSSHNISLSRRWLYFILSFFLGITTSNAVGKIIAALVPFVQLTVDQSLGALLSSAFIVIVLVYFLENKDVEKSIFSSIIKWLSNTRRGD